MGRLLTLAIPTLILCLMLPASLAAADHGGVSYDPGVTFDERAQNAIVAWNGHEEVLILTTEVRSEAEGRLLEFLPLPSCPKSITEGSVESFWMIDSLFYSGELDANSMSAYGWGGSIYPGIQMALHSTVGPHDITVVKVTSADSFNDWVRDFCWANNVKAPLLPEKLNSCVAGYVERNIKFFVFDVVQLSTDVRTIDPLVYRFDSEFLYYPLEVTRDTLSASGWIGHRVQLYLVTEWRPKAAAWNELTIGDMEGRSLQDKVPSSRLLQVSPAVSDLFPDGAYVSALGMTLSSAQDLAGLHDVQLSLLDFLDVPQILAFKLSLATKGLFATPSIASAMSEMEQDELDWFVPMVMGVMVLFSLALGQSLVMLFKRRAPGMAKWRLVAGAYSAAAFIVVVNLYMPFMLVKVGIVAVSALAVVMLAVMPAYRRVTTVRYGRLLKNMWKEPLI